MSPVNTANLGPGGGPNAPSGLGGAAGFSALKFNTSGSTSSAIAAFVVQGSASSFTVVTWADAIQGDVILVSPAGGAGVSSVSSGLIPWSHCTLGGQVEFRLSNVSTLVQNQTAQTWNFVRISIAT